MTGPATINLDDRTLLIGTHRLDLARLVDPIDRGDAYRAARAWDPASRSALDDLLDDLGIFRGRAARQRVEPAAIRSRLDALDLERVA